MATIPQTMRAWVYRRSGPVDKVLKLESEYPMVHLKNYPIIVKNKCVAMNPVAFKIISQMPCKLSVLLFLSLQKARQKHDDNRTEGRHLTDYALPVMLSLRMRHFNL